MCLSLAMTASRKQRDQGASVVGAAKELLLLKPGRGDGAQPACTALPKEYDGISYCKEETTTLQTPYAREDSLFAP